MTDSNFLIRYGIHNYVTHSHKKGRSVYSIEGTVGHKMIEHAKQLIKALNGTELTIRVI